MSEERINAEKLSEGQLLLRRNYEEDGQYYYMNYLDRQYTRDMREQRYIDHISYYNFIPPTFSDDGQDIQRDKFYRWFIGYTPDPRDTYFTCLFAAAQYLTRVDFLLEFLCKLWHFTKDGFWKELTIYFQDQYILNPQNVKLKTAFDIIFKHDLDLQPLRFYETPDVNYGFSKMVRPATPQDLTATTSSTSQPLPSGEPFAFTPKKKTGSVYAIKDKETQEIIYIGQTKDFAQRKQQHLNMIDHGTALWYPQAREDGYLSNKVEITILQDFTPDNIEERSKKEKELILKYKPKYNTQYLK